MPTLRREVLAALSAGGTPTTEELLELLAAGQLKLVLRDEDSIRQIGERIFHQRVVPACA